MGLAPRSRTLLPARAWTAAFERHADRTALVSQAGLGTSYGELDELCNKLANALLDCGLRQRDRLAVMLPNGPAIVQCYIAAAKSGLVMTPLSTRMTAYELAAQLRDAKPAALIYDASQAGLVDRATADWAPELLLPHADHERPIDPEPIRPGVASDAPEVEIDPEDPFCIMYSGGTSGVPKGVIQSHLSWAWCIESVVERWQLVAEDVHVIAFPMTHVAWFTGAALLSAGGSSILWREWDAARVLDTVEQRRVSTLNMAPTMLGDVLDELDRRPRDLSSLRLFTVPGAPLPAETYRRSRRLLGDILGNIYGMTESSGPITFLMPDEMASGHALSAGRAAEGLELVLVDERGEPVPLGAEGEVLLGGPQITRGYVSPVPEGDGSVRDGMLHTGDVGRLDEEGFLHIVGRKKEMIKSGGYNVYPREVEDAVMSHPAVLEAAVLGVPDARWIEAVTAVVALGPGASASSEELAEHCRRYLSRYKVPKAFHFIESLPRTVVGKVDKRALQARFKQGDPNGR
ncbi:MAG: class I adenylate-forming enzyme family protein [Solirubrobacteraceae bacterium]